VRGVLAKPLARIHRANLINWGVLPQFADPADYDAILLTQAASRTSPAG
jgi:aconitate hydratase